MQCCKRIPKMVINDADGDQRCWARTLSDAGPEHKMAISDAGPEHSPIDGVDLHTARQRMQGPAGLHIVTVDAGRLLLHSHTESVFSHTLQLPQSLLLSACLCARASVNVPPAQIDRSLTSGTLRFR
jgi:hypothetical protein